MEIISNDSLRNHLVVYYDYSSSLLKSIEDGLVSPHYNSILIPTMIKKFDFSWLISPAIPHNYEALKDDQEYLSFLKTTKSLRDYHLKYTQQLFDDTQLLKNQFENELNRLKRK